MINNKSDKPEKFEPQDSKQKEIHHPEDDQEAVLKPRDKDYNKEEANFAPPAKTKEEGEQPIHPVKKAPKDI